MQTTTPDAAAPEASTKQLIKRLRARFERWELDHLRNHSASLAEQLEAATTRAERAEAQLNDSYCWNESLQEELQQLADEQGVTIGLTQSGTLVVTTNADAPPAPGQHWPAQGGTYIGIASAEGDLPARHLVVLDQKNESRLNWEAAKAWAAGLGDGARLPTQLEAVLAWTTSHGAFESGYHCTSTQDSRYCAFVQDFENGLSYWYSKGYEHRVRAVRGLTLQTFTPLVTAAEGGSAEILEGGAQ